MEEIHALVIDDDPGICELIARILLREHVQVVTASSAEAGLEQLPYYTFHLAFLDQNLPGMEGLLLGEYLRKNNPDMQIALVTGESTARLSSMSAAHGIRFIEKPFDVGDILDVVSAWKQAQEERVGESASQESRRHAPELGEHLDRIRGAFDVPHVPERIQERLVRVVKERVHAIRSGRYSEEDRVVALAGLLAAEVIGVDLPRLSGDRTLREEYDAAMRRDGCQVEFSPEDDPGPE